jgi:hypothetical protein
LDYFVLFVGLFLQVHILPPQKTTNKKIQAVTKKKSGVVGVNRGERRSGERRIRAENRKTDKNRGLLIWT